MAIIRIQALRKMADLIGLAVPRLSGRICAGAAESPKGLAFPSLAITATKFKFFPDQAADHKHLGGTTVVLNVGRVEATVLFRLGAKTANQRYELQDEIMQQVFWADVERPGVVVLPLPECSDAVVAFELAEDEWEDEKAFDKKWYSEITTALQMPALVTKDSVHTINEIRLVLTDDLTNPIEDVSTALKETILISEDGTFISVPSP